MVGYRREMERWRWLEFDGWKLREGILDRENVFLKVGGKRVEI